MVHRQLTPSDYWRIAKRRWWILLVPVIIAPIVAYSFSLAIPNLYTSQTLVLVESQVVPNDFVRPVVTQSLQMRLVTMQEQILSRTRLQPIIERYGLYKGDVGKVPMEDLVDRLRKSVGIQFIHPEAAGAVGLPGFYISFTADTPRLAQQVCGEITTMFMNENIKDREQSAEGTTDFLKSQLEDSKRNLDEQDAKLAAFKGKYIGQLPGEEQANFNMLQTLNAQLNAVTENLTRARQDKTFNETLLNQALANYNTAVQAAQAAKAANGTNPVTIDQEIEKAQSRLTDLQSRYTDSHPDVVKAKGELAKLQRKKEEQQAQIAKTPAEPSDKSGYSEPQELKSLRVTVHNLEGSIGQLTTEQERIQKAIRDYQSKVQVSPQVEQEAKQLTRDYDIARKTYEDLLAKKTQSEMATNLERRSEGEQFRVMDPPNLPEKPSSPNRPAITMGGLAVGFGLGLGIVLLLEMSDTAVRSESDVKACLQIPILAVVPWTQVQKRSFRIPMVRRKKPQGPGAKSAPAAAEAQVVSA